MLNIRSIYRSHRSYVKQNPRGKRGLAAPTKEGGDQALPDSFYERPQAACATALMDARKLSEGDPHPAIRAVN